MKYLVLALALLSSHASAQSFLSQEPSERELRGAFMVKANAIMAKQYLTAQVYKFQKIDCINLSPKIFRCNAYMHVGMKSIAYGNLVSLPDVDTVDFMVVTKLNGTWMVIDN